MRNLYRIGSFCGRQLIGLPIRPPRVVFALSCILLSRKGSGLMTEYSDITAYLTMSLPTRLTAMEVMASPDARPQTSFAENCISPRVFHLRRRWRYQIVAGTILYNTGALLQCAAWNKAKFQSAEYMVSIEEVFFSITSHKTKYKTSTKPPTRTQKVLKKYSS